MPKDIGSRTKFQAFLRGLLKDGRSGEGHDGVLNPDAWTSFAQD
jgi:hypothetical protein